MKKTDTYIDIHDNTDFISNNQFIWTSEKDGYNHIYLIDYQKNIENQLTDGNWDVTEIYGYDEKPIKSFFKLLNLTLLKERFMH